MNPTRTLVALTGATGFIGRRLLRDLPARGYSVRALLRRPAEVPVDCASAVIGDIAKPHNMAAALEDVAVVIHLAGISPAAAGAPADDYRALNVEATIRLAQAAKRARVKRFVLLSSVRAQSGPVSGEVLTEELEAKPTDDYGRSKLAAERAVAGLGVDWTALRLAVVYGDGARGNMARLLQLARRHVPLPFAGLTAKRSILSLDNLVAALDCVLASPHPIGRPVLVADPGPLTLPQMIAAMRRGLGREPGLVRVPAWLLEAACGVAGRSDDFNLLAGPLAVDTSALSRLGWAPAIDSERGLEAFARTVPPGRGPDTRLKVTRLVRT
jgi:UDP-glucose 4-epimerase